MGTLQGTLRPSSRARRPSSEPSSCHPSQSSTPRALAIFYWRYGRLTEAETWLRRTVNLQPTMLDSRQRLASFSSPPAGRRRPRSRCGRWSRRPARPPRSSRWPTTTSCGSARPRPVAAREAGGARRRHRDSGAAAAGADSLPRTADRGGAPGGQRSAGADPNNGDALIVRAQLLLDEGSSTLAIDAAREAIGFHPAAASARLILAEAHLARNDTPQAIKTLNEALRMDPLLLPARLRLSQVHLRRDDLTRRWAWPRTRSGTMPTASPRGWCAPRPTRQGRAGGGRSRSGAGRAGGPDIPAAQAARAGRAGAAPGAAGGRTPRVFRALAVDPYLFEAIRGQATLEVLERHPDRAIALVDGVLKAVKDDPSRQQPAGIRGAGKLLRRSEQAGRGGPPARVPAANSSRTTGRLCCSWNRCPDSKDEPLFRGGVQRFRFATIITAVRKSVPRPWAPDCIGEGWI